MYRSILVFLMMFGWCFPVAAKPIETRHLDIFLDQVIEASHLETCAETEQALKKIPQDMIERANNALRTMTNLEEAEHYQKRFHEISLLTSRCPKVQDAFVNRMSRIALVEQISPARMDASRVSMIEDLKAFILASYGAIDASDCKKSAKNFDKISRDLCQRALVGFQTIERSALSETDQRIVGDKLEQVMMYGQKCSAFEEKYRRCLYSESYQEGYVPLSKIEPFMKWLDGLYHLLSKHRCEGVEQAIKGFDPTLTAEAKRVMTGMKPSQFSPEDRDQIRSKMKAVYQVLPQCEEARTGIDQLIEQMF